MFSKSILLGAMAPVFACLASLIYADVYQSSLGADFSNIINLKTVLSLSLFGGLLAGIGYSLLNKWLGKTGETIFNFLFVLLSFSSIIVPFGASLPLDIDYPELFPGLAVPCIFSLPWHGLP